MNEIITEILEREWKMFTSVNNVGGRASCQDDRATFTLMRSAQFMAWDRATLESYLEDVKAAENRGRNLVTEKYAHMMKYTAPEEYDNIKDFIPMPSSAAQELADRICRIIFRQTLEYETKYPNIARQGRPVSDDGEGTLTSIETYQKGELFTYSEKTLGRLLAHIEEIEQAGGNYPLNILEKTFMQYGFKSLEEAEAFLKKQ